ncbi:MAG TPA: Hsp20/alpha crystallin family protein [Candidatus Eisenbacteria bacterium]|nr:Hsp20/alpha crystallin family protein [Candidatus Eisenbacteria bacterium]
MNLVPRRRENSLSPRDTSLSPFRALFDLQREMNDLFDNFSLSRGAVREDSLFEGAWTPAIDVHDSKDDILVRADLPGLKKEDIEVSIQDGMLVIRGEKKEETERREKGAVRTERLYGSFHRAVSLPTAVDDTKVKASYKNGVLELTLPKKEEAKPKQIKIDLN